MPVKRDDKGRFIKGTSGNPKGRPRREVEEDYLAALSEEVSKADWRAIIRKAVTQARKGDYKARAWLGDYLVGKATTYIQADMSALGKEDKEFIQELAIVAAAFVPEDKREEYYQALAKIRHAIEQG